ncbi:MAG: hypothetical protein BGP24_19580 [Lysobacterales bacterium 69-70]|nr:hypothetical protein [Xanthomonadaceae bacterium]ODU34035.1 MAG: hypothetical protein ABS97_10380 [Xanthomonadaceae bacterium SCN 69-320]ODV18731.1 MAG: hypothetical protein ABT27_13090 [Xanthomonadaceae bacterium SCN 69-25]OJY93066.1 MAG: hypothetical protein BGP24_19580 [Xanthomonadales bacterium 69-70]
MSDTQYAVFLFPQAIEALGEPIKPYLLDGAGGPHIVCAEVDTSGPLFGMTLAGKDQRGLPSELEIMLPHAMIRLVMSVHSEHGIGFAQRGTEP